MDGSNEEVSPTEPVEAVDAATTDLDAPADPEVRFGPRKPRDSSRDGWAIRPAAHERLESGSELGVGLQQALFSARPAESPKGQDLRDVQLRESTTSPTWVLAGLEVPDAITDDSNARRFVADHRGHLRYRPDRGCWMAWADDRWVKLDKAELTQYARVTAAHIQREAAASGDAKARREAASVASRRSLSAMVELAAGDEAIRAEGRVWNYDPWLLNTKSSTIDLETGTGLTYSPNNFIDRMAPTLYKPTSPAERSPTWERFLKQMFEGDEELIAYVQRFIGYCLTAVVREHALFVLYGPGGNGKSVFLNTIMQILGPDYSVQLDSDLLIAKGAIGDTNYGLADLEAKRFAVASEVDEGARLSEALVKQLTGGDTIRARRIREAPFEFRPTAKIVIATNHPPVVSSTDDGIWRRIKLIPAPGRVAKPDPTLPAKLLTQRTAILDWMVQGCLEWQRLGLGTCAAVEAATADYRASMDVLGAFITDACEVAVGERVSTSDLYAAYANWANANGFRPWTQNAFSRKLKTRGFEPGKSADGKRRIWKGLSVRVPHVAAPGDPVF
ncbi:hypothetical protein KSP35_01855 [Aquihabitans sp. G128]|uniref:DNA primase family protein n=1 Tax=Aquihabitans sp. G128 TaxID=2849779 RepID=UPI001C211F33|nr:phage/plasmid primase, P4 family [Aquihabitans sp. G128]QXC61618.1 hypothetical protein KSP35_01855 [Aquihabitans sp. G128]